MYRLLLVLVPAILFAGQTRYARLGEMEGKVEVQLHAADPWSTAERNLTLAEAAWLRTAAASRLEVELDDGSAVRLGPDSLIEFSDYTRLSTGQRLTVLSLDRGLAYFTGEPAGRDSLALAVPGAQITLLRGARVRVEALTTFSRITVIEGTIRLSCPAAELDIREGQTVRVEPANTSRFSLEREVAPMELDRWSEDRDKLLAAPASASHISVKYGLADLDSAGEWLTTDIGPVWKPKTASADGWAPYQKGRWRWYDTLGYTWVSDEAWGWLPYHYGRWTRKNDLGWVWAPPVQPVFKPGDVYWLHGKQLAGWGALAPGEDWQPSAAPQQFLNVNTTYATLATDARVIDPAGFSERPKEPLGVAVFALALPSPAWLASRLEAVRPPLRAGAVKAIAPVVPGTAFQDVEAPPPPPPQPMPPAVVTNPADDGPPIVQPGSGGDPGPPGPPMQVIYPVPVYTGIVVINPPEHPDYSRRRNGGGNNGNGGNNSSNNSNGNNNSGGNNGQPSNSGQNGAALPSGRRPPQSSSGGATTPGWKPTPPGVPTPPQRIDPPPHVETPGPARTDRPRIESLPSRGENPHEEPRERPAPKVESKPAESKPEAKPDVKPDVKPEVKPDVKPDFPGRKK